MDITQEDLLLVLKSVKDELVQEELEAKKAAKEKEASEASESSTSDSSPAPEKQKAADETSESSETSTEESKAKPFEKKKSAEEVVAVEAEQPVDLYQTYVGLGQENIEDLKNHSIAATMALMAHAGQDMSNHWTAFKSAKEDIVTKSIDEQLAQEVEAAKAFAAKTEEANQKLIEKNVTLEKSLKEAQSAVAELSAKFAELAKQPQAAQAASVRVSAQEQVIVKQPSDIVKSLAEAAKTDTLTDKDRELITRYTLRPKMTEELQEFLKKIGSVK